MMRYRNLYRPKWFDSFMRKFFKKTYMKKYLKMYPGSIYKYVEDDGSVSVVIDLATLFNLSDPITPEDVIMVETFQDELSEMSIVYEKMKNI